MAMNSPSTTQHKVQTKVKALVQECADGEEKPDEIVWNALGLCAFDTPKNLIKSMQDTIWTLSILYTAVEEKWFNSSGIKLNAERWIFWADKLGVPCPVAALGPVSWEWKTTPPAPIEVNNHTSALLNLPSLVPELDKAEKLGLIEFLQADQDQADFVSCINPFGVRIKPNGKARILVDPTITGLGGTWDSDTL
eukprot:gene14766-biopygen23787